MITFYTASSLDGYIARNDGSIDWLCGGNDSMEDYVQFIARVDCLVMGRSTYDKVPGFGQWPYHQMLLEDGEPKLETEFVGTQEVMV